MRCSVFLSAIVALLLGGCMSDSSPTAKDKTPEVRAKNPQPSQIIIKFRGSADPSRPQYVEQLATSAGIGLAYVRPLSGGAHLYFVEGAGDPGKLAQAIERLSKRPDVEYVEPDRILRNQ